MEKFNFRFTVHADKATGQILAAYLQVRRGKAHEVKELADGAAFANYNDKGKLLGLEILGPCEVTVIEKITTSEPLPVRNFLKRNVPRRQAMLPQFSARSKPNVRTLAPSQKPIHVRHGRRQ